MDLVGVTPVVGNVLTPAQAVASPRFNGQGTVTMNFPQQIDLSIDYSTYISYPAGSNPVPTSLSTHWWLVTNGATVQG